jgi:hypothetical protein
MINTSGAQTDMAFNITVTRQGSDYRTPSKAIGLPQQRVAVLRDEKASGTSGGTATTAFTARAINTLQDPTGIVSNPASFTGVGGTNTQVILSSGRYYIEASSVFNTDILSKIRLFNVTTSSSLLEGTASDSNPGSSTMSSIGGFITLSAQSTLEIQASSNVANANGWGAPSVRGGNEVYTIVTITRVEE